MNQRGDQPIRSALWELTVARTKETIRTPEAMFWVFAFPILLALALGFAFKEKPPDRIPIGIAAGPRAQEIAAAVSSSPVLLPSVADLAPSMTALRAGRISLLIVVNDGIELRFDPTRPESRIAQLETENAIQSAASRRDPIAIRKLHVRESGARYIDFLIPGLVGLNLMSTGMWGVGFSIVMARAQKLLKRFVATPMRRSDYLLAQILSRLVFLLPEIGLLIGFGWLVFDVRVHGSIALLAAVSVIGAMTFSGLGVLVASRVETVEGVSGLMNLVMMPMWLLSGVFFSASRFPEALQPVIKALPLTALNDALRAVMNEGRGVESIASELLILTAWGVASFVASVRLFRWQ